MALNRKRKFPKSVIVLLCVGLIALIGEICLLIAVRKPSRAAIVPQIKGGRVSINIENWTIEPHKDPTKLVVYFKSIYSLSGYGLCKNGSLEATESLSGTYKGSEYANAGGEAMAVSKSEYGSVEYGYFEPRFVATVPITSDLAGKDVDFTTTVDVTYPDKRVSFEQYTMDTKTLSRRFTIHVLSDEEIAQRKKEVTKDEAYKNSKSYKTKLSNYQRYDVLRIVLWDVVLISIVSAIIIAIVHAFRKKSKDVTSQ